MTRSRSPWSSWVRAVTLVTRAVAALTRLAWDPFLMLEVVSRAARTSRATVGRNRTSVCLDLIGRSWTPRHRPKRRLLTCCPPFWRALAGATADGDHTKPPRAGRYRDGRWRAVAAAGTPARPPP